MAFESGQQNFNPVNPHYGANVAKTMAKKENEAMFKKMQKLVTAYNSNPSAFNDVEAEKIALIAKTIGLPFQREVKPLRNLLYGAAEGLTMGLAPNSWRPDERGESIYGRSMTNKAFSGAGMVGGGLLGLRTGTALIGMGGKGATALGSRVLGGLGSAGSKVASSGVGQSVAAGARTVGQAATAGARSASQYATGVGKGISGIPNVGAPMYESAGAGLGNMVRGGFQTGMASFGTPAWKAAQAQARSVYNAGFYYGGQAMSGMRNATGLSTFMG